MSLPTYDQLALPLMLLLSELDKPIKVSDAANILAERSKLSSEVLNQTLPSGKNIFKDRVAWSKTYLVKAGLINQPQRAYCEISELGKTIDLNGLDAITNEFLSQFDGFREFKFGRKNDISEENTTINEEKKLQVFAETQKRRNAETQKRRNAETQKRRNADTRRDDRGYNGVINL